MFWHVFIQCVLSPNVSDLPSPNVSTQRSARSEEVKRSRLSEPLP